MQNIKHYLKKAAPLWCGLFVVLIFKFFLFVGYVPTESMEPTIGRGDFILGTRVYPALQNGDLVVFKREGYYLVKRIVAGPGETVYIRKTGEITNAFDSSSFIKAVHVPADHYFVVGDNREHSHDSRYWEQPCINEAEIVAMVFGF